MNTRPYITLEISSACNLSCDFCSQHNKDIFKKGFMSFELFKKLIDEISENNEYCSINPYFRGESLLHPQFNEFMDYIYESSLEKPVCEYIVLHTNGLLLNEKNAKSILRVCDQSRLIHPGNLIISIDAASPDTYTKIRGGNFILLIENIKGFLKLRNKYNQWGPNIVFQFIIQNENSEEAIKFVELIKGICSKYSHKNVDTVASFKNRPFEIKNDIIYFRMLESDAFSQKEYEILYRDTVKHLAENIEIEIFDYD